MNYKMTKIPHPPLQVTPKSHPCSYEEMSAALLRAWVEKINEMGLTRPRRFGLNEDDARPLEIIQYGPGISASIVEDDWEWHWICLQCGAFSENLLLKG